jgi:hypothetical protein
MGLSFRKRSGRIANGSRLIVPGQITTGEKVFEITFNGKQNPYDGLQLPPFSGTPSSNQ